MLNTDPNRVLRTTADRTPVMPSPKDAGQCIELRFVLNYPFMHVVSLNGDGTQCQHEPIDSRNFKDLEAWRENINQWALDAIEHLIRAPWPTEERKARKNAPIETDWVLSR